MSCQAAVLSIRYHNNDAENVHPAPPALASTLLDVESECRKTVKSAEPFQTGVKRLDANLPPSLWTGGKVVGIVSDGGESRVRIYISKF
jgi:hypothetical protein